MGKTWGVLNVEDWEIEVAFSTIPKLQNEQRISSSSILSPKDTSSRQGRTKLETSLNGRIWCPNGKLANSSCKKPEEVRIGDGPRCSILWSYNDISYCSSSLDSRWTQKRINELFITTTFVVSI